MGWGDRLVGRSEDRYRIRLEEQLRHEAREDIAYRQQTQSDKAEKRFLKNQRLISEHGRGGAFWITMSKWAAVGSVVGVFGFIGSPSHEGLWEAIKTFFNVLLFFAAIGVWRGLSVLRSF